MAPAAAPPERAQDRGVSTASRAARGRDPVERGHRLPATRRRKYTNRRQEHRKDRGEHEGQRRCSADVAARGQVVEDPDRDDLGPATTAGEQVDVVEVVERPDEPEHAEQSR